MVKSSETPKSSRILMSAAMNSHTKIVRPVKTFSLKSTNEFASRSVDIFSSLTTLENKHQSWVSHNETHESFDEHNVIPEPVQSVPHVFKKPFVPLLPKQKAAVSSRNKRGMKKWIKYSLADVPLSSDATNSAVAFQFLSELRKKKEQAEVTSSSEEKVVFCKPRNKKQSNLCDGNVSFGSTSCTEKLSNNEPSPNSKIEIILDKKGVAPNIKLMHLEDDE